VLPLKVEIVNVNNAFAAEGSSDWIVVLPGRTQRATQACEGALQDAGFVAYAPLTGYCFLRQDGFPLESVRPAIRSNRFLTFGGRLAKVRQFEIDKLRCSIATNEIPVKPAALRGEVLRRHRVH
jgi:hypothetical protein